MHRGWRMAMRLYVAQYFLGLSLACIVTATVGSFFSMLVFPGALFSAASYVAWRERRADEVRGRGWLAAGSVLNCAVFLPMALHFGQIEKGWILWVAQGMWLVVLLAFRRSSHPPLTRASAAELMQ